MKRIKKIDANKKAAKKIMKGVSKIEKQLAKSFKQKTTPSSRKVDPSKLVPTGSTTFNLECSGRVEGAFALGKLVNLIGDSHAGKTLFALTAFAECSLQERFDDFDFIYDDVEAANEFDIPYLFGERVDNRIDQSIRSKTIEEFNDNIARALEGDKKFIYILDSFDGLTSEAAIKKDSENRTKREKGNKTDGSYGDGKAKKASEMFSQRIQDLSDHGSLIIIISQTRDNIGFGAKFTPKVRSGGKALKFYAAHEIWLACEKKEKKGKRTVVTNVIAKITKNKLTGRHGEAYFPILFDYGVDNIVGCINFICDEGSWKDAKGVVSTNGFVPNSIDSKGKEKKGTNKAVLVKHIEDNNLEEELFQVCQETYDAVMEKLKPQRKRKY